MEVVIVIRLPGAKFERFQKYRRAGSIKEARKIIEKEEIEGLVVDSLENLERKKRIGFINYLQGRREIAAVTALLVAPPLEILGEEDFEEVKRFEAPNYWEGFDKIVAEGQGEFCNLEEILENLGSLYQETPYHSEISVGAHCLKAYQEAIERDYCEEVKEAALFHDIGKGYTKKIEDRIAKYRGHHNVGAYIYLSNQGIVSEKILEIANLINLHMEKFFRNIQGEKKLQKLVGEEFYKKLKEVEICDERAH